MTEHERIRHLWAAVLSSGIEDHRLRVQASAKGKRKIKMDGISIAVRDHEAEVKTAREWLVRHGPTLAERAGVTLNVESAMQHIVNSVGVCRGTIRGAA